MIQVNGDPLDWTPGLTVRGVIRAKNYKFPLLIVTIDGVRVERSAFDATPVPDGAVVQVMHLLSGG
jgi:sulfur carrier protein